MLVYCRTENRSAYAAGLLQADGYKVVQLIGGYSAWQESGGEVVVETPEMV